MPPAPTTSASPAPTDDALAGALGHRLRAARTAAGLSMRALAASAGVSQPFLSQVENGTTSPSLASLYRLADALGISPAALLPAPQGDTAVVVIRAGEGESIPVSDLAGSARGRLLSAGPGHRLEVVEYRVAPGQDLGDWFESDGEMTVYLADGRLEVEVEDHGRWTLEAGDAVTHPARLRHRWRADDDAPARVLLALAHEHAGVVEPGGPAEASAPAEPGVAGAP